MHYSNLCRNQHCHTLKILKNHTVYINLYKNIKFLSNFVLHILKIPRVLFSSFRLCNLQKLEQLFPPQCTLLRLVECTTLCIWCLLTDNICSLQICIFRCSYCNFLSYFKWYHYLIDTDKYSMAIVYSILVRL